MKKFFTLALALMGIASTASAATDIAVCKHSYVLVADDFTNNGTEKITANSLYGDGFFFTPTGQDISNGKGSVDLSDAATWGEEIATKYGEYGKHLNSLRIKNAQDVMALSVTQGSKIIVFFNGQGKSGASARLPRFCKTADMSDDNTLNKNEKPTAETGKISTAKVEYVAVDDMVIYIGSYNGDTYISYVIVEANEAPGTPSVKVGDQTYENGLWFREVTCKPVQMDLDGELVNTVVTYTDDGSTPTAESKVYTEPIKCYKDMVVKFQAFMEEAVEGMEAPGAENEGIVSFAFNAPSIDADGADVNITTEYENATNYYQYAGIEFTAGNNFTLTESASITAYTEIKNGSYATFTTKKSYKDVYVLNAIKEAKTIAVDVTNATFKDSINTKENKVDYYVEGAATTANKMDFFVKNLEFAVIGADSLVKYQVDGQKAYIKMNNTTISFLVAEGDTVDVEVVCSKNSCKTMWNDEDPTKIDRKCYVNVDGKTYGSDDITNGDAANLDGYANVIKFGLKEGIHTFQKYSGTGNILISSIKITPAEKAGISTIAAEKQISTKKVMVGGQLIIKTANGNYNAAGMMVK